MAKRRPKGSRLQGGANAAETSNNEAAAGKGKSNEPKAKKSRLSKTAEVIHIECSPEKEVSKSVRSSKLSRSTTQEKKKEDEPQAKLSKTSDPVPPLENHDKPRKSQAEPIVQKVEEKGVRSVSFEALRPFYNNHGQEFTFAQNDFPLCSQSAEAQCDVIWQSTSPISFTQAANVTYKSTDTADLIKKYSYTHSDPGSPILKMTSTPPLLGLWSSASTSKANAKRRMRGPKGWGMKRPSGAGPGVSSEDIIMKLDLVLDSKPDLEKADVAENPASHIIDAGIEQAGSQQRASSQPTGSASPSKECNRSLDLFESEGYLTQPSTSPAKKVCENAANTGVEKALIKSTGMSAKKDGTNDVVRLQKKSTSLGFMVSQAGDAIASNCQETTMKPSNQSCEDLWSDDDMEDDSFVLKATQDLFDSEAFSTPKANKGSSKTSTPLGGKKGGRLTFSLNPINVKQPVTAQSSVAPFTATASISSSVVGATELSLSSNNAKVNDSNGLLNVKQTNAFKKPLPALVSTSEAKVPFQTYSHKTNSNGTGVKTSQNNSIIHGAKKLSHPMSSASSFQVPPKKPVSGVPSKPVVSELPTKPAGTVASAKQMAAGLPGKTMSVSVPTKPVVSVASAKPMVARLPAKPMTAIMPTKSGVAGSASNAVVTGVYKAPKHRTRNTVMKNANANKSTPGSTISSVESNSIQIGTVVASKANDINSQISSRSVQKPGSASLPLMPNAFLEKTKTVASFSIPSDVEMMDNSLGDDLLLSLLEPDEQLDNPKVTHKIPDKPQLNLTLKNPVPQKLTQPKKPSSIIKSALPINKVGITHPIPPLGNNQKPNQVIKQIAATPSRTENAWDEDEDDELLLMTSQVMESSMQTAPDVDKKSTFVHNVHIAKQGAMKSKPYSFTPVMSKSKSLSSGVGLKTQKTVVHTHQNSTNSSSTFSKLQAPLQTTNTSSRPTMSISAAKPSVNIPGYREPIPKPSYQPQSARFLPVGVVPTLSKTSNVNCPNMPTNPTGPSASAVDQLKGSGMEDAFPGDDEMLCEDQVLAMLDNIESQQMSEKTDSSLILSSTQKPVPGPTQQPNVMGATGPLEKVPGQVLNSAKLNNNQNALTKTKSFKQNVSAKNLNKSPLVPLTENQSRPPPKGTPPVPDISPIKPCSQSDIELLGSTINLAIVDQHYPKCSPEEIERKKAEALKRRLKKKPAKVSPVV